MLSTDNMLSVTPRMEECLISATVQAFERMCFAAVEPVSTDASSESGVRGRVWFEGNAAGDLCLMLSDESVRIIASSFLGDDESALSGSHAQDVITELANVICGSMLSVFSNEGHFVLSTDSTKGCRTEPRDCIRQAFRGDAGEFAVEVNVNRSTDGDA